MEMTQLFAAFIMMPIATLSYGFKSLATARVLSELAFADSAFWL
jgi:hypothetical protein